MNKDVIKQKIGIVGGGQLGKMMILEAKKMGFYVTILDPVEKCPAHSIADNHIVAEFYDEEAFRKLAECSDIITYEFEHIQTKYLKNLEDKGYCVYPTVKSLEIIQNKFTQKELLRDSGISVPKFYEIESIEDIYEHADTFSYPIMLKACTGGYDGKGNAVIKSEQDIEVAYEQLGAGKIPLMAEEFIKFEKEISVLACRGIDGTIAIYPVGENKHCNSILDETYVPARITEQVTKKAMSLANEVMQVFDGVGMFCVEMFTTKENEVYINEVAPRPHNSGHYTIDGCYTSQFEQHIRAITGLPFGSVELIKPIVMKNILAKGDNGLAKCIGVEEVLKDPKVKVHIYGKEMAKVDRKMGHMTVIGDTLSEAIDKMNSISDSIKIVGGDKI